MINDDKEELARQAENAARKNKPDDQLSLLRQIVHNQEHMLKEHIRARQRLTYIWALMMAIAILIGFIVYK